ncbi:hypothetical protein D1872_256330 [compost metagenome]
MLKLVLSSPNNLCIVYFLNRITWLLNPVNPDGFSPSCVSTVIFPVPVYLFVLDQSEASRSAEYHSKLSSLPAIKNRLLYVAINALLGLAPLIVVSDDPSYCRSCSEPSIKYSLLPSKNMAASHKRLLSAVPYSYTAVQDDPESLYRPFPLPQYQLPRNLNMRFI